MNLLRTIFVALRAFIFMSAFVSLWAWVALSLRGYDRELGISLPTWTQIPGTILMLMGGVLALTCVALFVVQGRGTPAPFDAPREFVAAGPYRCVRNPMYVGGWVVLIGFGLYLHSGAILLFSLGWLLLAHLFVVFFEEPVLREKFGAAYRDYCQTVSRWIPRW